MKTPESVIDPAGEATRVLEFIREESRIWDAQDRSVWSALVRLRGNRLPKGDEVLLARRIHGEFATLKTTLKRQGLTLGDFCAGARLGVDGDYSKELHRLMLPATADPAKARLRRSAAKYRVLIEAMAKVLGVSKFALAEQLLRDTSLYGGNSEERSEVEWVEASLQLLVDAVNVEFKLQETFRETAELKAAHAAQGGDCRWPHHEASSGLAFDNPELGRAEARRIECLLEDRPYQQSAEELALEREAAVKERNDAMKVERAYWLKPVTKSFKTFDSWLKGPTPSGCLQDDSFFYIPHAYLGHGEGVCNPIDPALSPQEHQKELDTLRTNVLNDMKQSGAEPLDEWNTEQQCPTGQTSSLPHSAALDHVWLVAYPAPGGQRIMPMMYLAVEECGPLLVPLDCVALSALKKLYWVGPDGSVSTYLDRIKSLLLAPPEGGGPIKVGLRRTAPWLKSNPFLKDKQRALRGIEQLKALHKSLLSENLAQCIARKH